MYISKLSIFDSHKKNLVSGVVSQESFFDDGLPLLFLDSMCFGGATREIFLTMMCIICVSSEKKHDLSQEFEMIFVMW